MSKTKKVAFLLNLNRAAQGWKLTLTSKMPAGPVKLGRNSSCWPEKNSGLLYENILATLDYLNSVKD